jgi:Bacterial TSP3 repeat
MQAQQLIPVLSLTLLLTILIVVHAHAAQVQLSWTAPTTDTNGAPLTDLAGYHVYYGLTSLSYDVSIDVGLTTSAALSGLGDGLTHYFAVTAYDQAGNESAFSDEVAHTLSAVDSDGDGLADVDEIVICGTNPTQADSDGDGLSDGAEVAMWGTAWQDDADADGVINLLDPDADADGVPDGIEVSQRSDPADPQSVPGGGASRCLRMISSGPTPEWWAMVGWKSKAVLGPGSSMGGWSLTRPMMRSGH